MQIDKARELALKIIYEINENGAYSNIAINKYLEQSELKKIDRSFITELVYGTVKWKMSIDWIIHQFSNIKFNKISPWILNIMRLGVYQIAYMNKIPISAACNESVNLSKKYGHKSTSGFVNGVLRNIGRNINNIKYPNKKESLTKYLSVKYSHPEYMVSEWVKRFGEEFTENLLIKNNEIPKFSIRTNTLKITIQKLIEELKEAGIESDKGKYIDEAIILKNPSSISKLESFKKGHFQVQDESSMLVGKVLNPKSGQFVVDVCSAPGGKSTHIAQIMNNKGTVISRDFFEHKIQMIDDSAKRLGINIIKAEKFDATILDESLIGKADKVLVDAPCTGLGIIRRKPDIKWSRDIKDKKAIVSLQKEMLRIASKYVNKTGEIVYSTCTIEPEENEEVVKKFINSNPEFEFVDITQYLPHGMVKETSKYGYIQLYPNIDDIDGFFVSKMRRR